MIELYNITAAFINTETGNVAEEIEHLDLKNLQLNEFSTHSLAYEFKIYGGLADDKQYTFTADLAYSETDLNALNGDIMSDENKELEIKNDAGVQFTSQIL